MTNTATASAREESTNGDGVFNAGIKISLLYVFLGSCSSFEGKLD